MKKYINTSLSVISYILVFIVYPLELSLFGNKISNTTSQAAYIETDFAYNILLPIILIMIGIFFSYRSRKLNESVWAGPLFLFGIVFLTVSILLTLMGWEINGSEALLNATHLLV